MAQVSIYPRGDDDGNGANAGKDATVVGVYFVGFGEKSPLKFNDRSNRGREQNGDSFVAELYLATILSAVNHLKCQQNCITRACKTTHKSA